MWVLGSGFFSKELLRNTGAREALCIDTSYPEESETTIAGKPLRFKNQCGVLEADLVLMMDVLEHVDDDVGFLRSYVQHAPTGGHFLITVPAFAFLWSSHDVFLEHKRRYSLPQLEAVAATAGLTVLESAYYFGLVFPIAAAMRLAERAPHYPDCSSLAIEASQSIHQPYFLRSLLRGVTVRTMEQIRRSLHLLPRREARFATQCPMSFPRKFVFQAVGYNLD